MMHTLLSYPEYFEATIRGEKTHELRQDSDSGPFQVGDILRLYEYDPVKGDSTGRACRVRVTYISPKPKPWLPAGYTLMSTKLLRWWQR